MLELFKAQISMEELKAMSLREFMMLREIRVDRYNKEREQIENDQRKHEEAMQRAQARNAILKK